jgi:OmpR-family two-component system manganese-sensing response regulator
VDDDKDSCDLVRAMLHYSDSNYEVTSTESSKEAVSLMKEQSFDLYILDYSLPEISGLELCHFIRKNNPSKPIMFLTAMAYPIHRASGLTAGADEYLIKPNDLGELIETINQLLNANSSSTCDTPNKLQESNSIF